MTREVRVAKEHRCERCGKVFANLMRLQHHIAAEHALKTSRDILTTPDILRTSKDIPATHDISHRPKSNL